MASSLPSIFNAKATEKLRSPDDLDKYVRVTNPSVWVVLAACGLLLAGLFTWGLFGTVATSVTSTGVSVKGEVLCFLPTDKAASVRVGDSANVGGNLMRVSSLSSVPLSREEAKNVVESDYLASALFDGEWAYVVRFEDDEPIDFVEGRPLTVNITTDQVSPLSLILGKRA